MQRQDYVAKRMKFASQKKLEKLASVLGQEKLEKLASVRKNWHL